MDEILEIYRSIKDGKQNMDIINYDNINVHFSGGVLNVYDFSGKMPCGKYKLPSKENEFIEMLEGINKRVGEIIDANQYICGRCGQTFDLPEFKRDRYGIPVCENCCDGGDIRKPTKTSEEKPKESEIPSTVPKKSSLSVESAIKLLQESGYVVKKLAKSFKCVYMDANNIERVSDDYYKNKEEFIKSHSEFKFVTLVKELSKADEENL